jgi:hypothetical protein
MVEEFHLDPERVRAAAKAFFRTEDPWLRKVSYNLGAFVQRFQQCDVQAQNRQRAGYELAPTSEPEAEGDDLFAAMAFAAAKGTIGG